MVGENTFSGVDYTGSLFVDTLEDEDRDYVGFIFSYQVTWLFLWTKLNRIIIIFLPIIHDYSRPDTLSFISEQ